jgi:hypothetical protein
MSMRNAMIILTWLLIDVREGDEVAKEAKVVIEVDNNEVCSEHEDVHVANVA